ncbi:MAG: hypothetical protein M3R17_14640 [Bacteroidota bacterium]|nr:hypothetical protein [Bacteroidota bacterium]
MLLIYRLKTVTTTFQKVVAILGFVVGFLFLFPAFLFSIQRWPGGALLYFLGTAGGLVFLILFFVSENKSGKPFSLFQPFTVIISIMLLLLLSGRYFVRQRSADNAKQNMAEYDKVLHERAVLEQGTNEEYIKIVNDTGDTVAIRKAEKLHRVTSDVLQYINEMRGELVASSEGIDTKVGDTISASLIANPTDYDTPTHYFIGSDPANVTGRAKDLNTVLKNYFGEYYSPDRIKDIKPADIYSNDYEKIISWEWYYFYHKTIIEALTKLEKIKIDILRLEKQSLEQKDFTSPK